MPLGYLPLEHALSGEPRPTSAATHRQGKEPGRGEDRRLHHDNPDASPLDHDIAKRYAEGIPITVVSDTLTADDTGPWRDQTTIVRRADSHKAVARLREQDGDALIFGSQTLWTDLRLIGVRTWGGSDNVVLSYGLGGSPR